MRLLLDTHALLWWTHDHGKLSAKAFAAIRDGANDVYVSAVTAMEIATKNRLGKLEYPSTLATNFVEQVAAQGFEMLAIDCRHAIYAGGLSGLHRDPWDRLLVAQAQVEGLSLVSVDADIPSLGIKAYW